MTDHILLICSSVIIYEFILYIKLKKLIELNFNIYKKIFRLFSNKKISDFKKEKLIFIYSKELFLVSIKIGITLILIIFFILVMNFLSNTYLNFLLSILGVIELSIIFLIYNLIRKYYE